MIRYFVQRPIGVLVTFAALIISGIYLSTKVPVSLLPEIDVPQMVVRVDYPNTPAINLEENILKPIRESLFTLNDLKDVESKAANHTGLILLKFKHGTKMDMAFIEANEKIDRITNQMPRDLQRPQVIQVNTSDIPVARIQITPVKQSDFNEISMLTEKVLKKRVEQIPGVSLVDLNGSRDRIISITPNSFQLQSIGMTEELLVAAINAANIELGGLSLKDGQYRYFVGLGKKLRDIEDLSNLPIRTINGSVFSLSKLATIQYEDAKSSGYHLFNGKEGLVITVHKQAESRMNDLISLLHQTLENFKIEYPQALFSITQDQSFLLDAGIDNLKQDLFYGGILTILLLFLFLGNIASPVLMSISIPLSLIITCSLFYAFDISFNIISLSGLALGIGMLIDNSIVVMDNITRKRRDGHSMLESSVLGTNEVITPVISQVLTTVAVYAPLVLLSGMAGSLVTDQSIALTISLCVSLLIAFILVPLLYNLFLKVSPEKLKEDTIFYRWVSQGYHKMIQHILKRKLFYFLVTVLIMPIGFIIANQLPVTNLPAIEKKESLVKLDWGSSIDIDENLHRVQDLYASIKKLTTVFEAEVGIKQFLLQYDNNAIQKAELYYQCETEKVKMTCDSLVSSWIAHYFPETEVVILDAPNAFTQLFTDNDPYFEVRFRSGIGAESSLMDMESSFLDSLQLSGYTYGAGALSERSIELTILQDKLNLYGIDPNELSVTLNRLFGHVTVSEIKEYGSVKPILLNTSVQSVSEKLQTTISNNYGVHYALHTIIRLAYHEQPKYITADKYGRYLSMYIDSMLDAETVQSQLKKTAINIGYTASFAGTYFSNQEQLEQLVWIFILVIILLYLILAIQYESLLEPIIVMLTIPIGITGAMTVLWFTGSSLDVMAAVGFIVILGLIVDDPILKIETLNRLDKKYAEQGLARTDALLEQMIHEAGDHCLKPLLMVSLTTSIAMVPVLFSNGIGNDLQKPLAYVIIGGLTIGTFFTTWFIPLAYWYFKKWTRS
jgi:multidrug efflux pump subunit AcrB